MKKRPLISFAFGTKEISGRGLLDFKGVSIIV